MHFKGQKNLKRAIEGLGNINTVWKCEAQKAGGLKVSLIW